MASLLPNIYKIKSSLENEIIDLRLRVGICEAQGINNSFRLERCEMLVNDDFKEIKLLDEKFFTMLSKYPTKKKEKIPYVFNAPQRNRYFTGRSKEIRQLKRILKVEEIFYEKKVRVAAVCGLGGIGKTSLASEYAHQMKDLYKGGVYWFSAEDDGRLNETVNDVATKIGAKPNSFDSTWPNILKKIGTTDDPCLFVLDCLDQLHLSPIT